MPVEAKASRPGPDFLVIGAARSGTTLLCHHLGRHRDVHFTDPKEPHFLSFGGCPPAFTGPGDDVTINRRAVTDEAAWRNLFDTGDAERLCGEGSVSTLYYAERAIESIDRHCPDVAMIAVLRDPVDRAWSAHQYLTGRGYEQETFERALADEPDRRAAGWHHLWHYVEMGRYASQLEPFLDRYGPDRLLVLDHDRLIAEPQCTLDRCFAFLGLQPMSVGTELAPLNASSVPRSRIVAAGLRGVGSAERVRGAVRRVLPLTLRERIRTLASAPPDEMSAEARDRLEDVFHDERIALRTVLGSSAPAWAGVSV